MLIFSFWLSFVDHEFNPLYGRRRILVDHCQITRRKVHEFPTPSGVGNFHSKNTIGEAQGAGAIRDRAATRNGPGEARALARRRATKCFRDHGFEAGGSVVQG